MNFLMQPRCQGKSEAVMLLMHHSLKFQTIETGIPTKDITMWDTKRNECVVWKATGEVCTKRNLEDNWLYKMYMNDTNKMLK